jgi:hypothetical protein
MTASTQADMDDDEAREGRAPAPAEGLAASILAFAALALVLIAPFATRAQPPGRAWYLAPVAWPLVCLGLTVIAGGVLVFRFARAWSAAPDRRAFRRQALRAFDGTPLAIEHALWFCLYLAAVGQLGFALASFVYLQFVVWRVGLRAWRWAMIAFLVTIGLVLIFRVGIGIWFPLAPVLRLLPDWVGNTLGGVL